MALEDIKDELTKKLQQAQKKTTSINEEVARKQFAFRQAANRKNKIEETNAALATTNDLRSKVEVSFDVLTQTMEARKKDIEPTYMVFLRMKDEAKTFFTTLDGHKTTINGGNAAIKDILTAPINDTLKSLDDVGKMWDDLCTDFETVIAGLESTKGIPKMLDVQKDKLKDIFEIDLKTELTDAEKGFNDAKDASELATKNQKDNQDKISTLTAQLKLF